MKILVVMGLLTGAIAWAHDGGHGPQDNGNQNERAVILASETKKGKDAKAIYGAVLDNHDDEVIVSLKSAHGGAEPDLTKFLESADGTLIALSKRKKSSPKKFGLKKISENGKTFYKGKLPHVDEGLYELEVELKEGDRKLFVAFPKVEGHRH